MYPIAGQDGVHRLPQGTAGRATVAGPDRAYCSAVISACALASRPRSPRSPAWASWHDRITKRRSCQQCRWPATSAVTGASRSNPSAISSGGPPGGVRWSRLNGCSPVHTGVK